MADTGELVNEILKGRAATGLELKGIAQGVERVAGTLGDVNQLHAHLFSLANQYATTAKDIEASNPGAGVSYFKDKSSGLGLSDQTQSAMAEAIRMHGLHEALHDQSRLYGMDASQDELANRDATHRAQDVISGAYGLDEAEKKHLDTLKSFGIGPDKSRVAQIENMVHGHMSQIVGQAMTEMDRKGITLQAELDKPLPTSPGAGKFDPNYGKRVRDVTPEMVGDDPSLQPFLETRLQIEKRLFSLEAVRTQLSVAQTRQDFSTMPGVLRQAADQIQSVIGTRKGEVRPGPTPPDPSSEVFRRGVDQARNGGESFTSVIDTIDRTYSDPKTNARAKAFAKQAYSGAMVP